MAVVEAGVSVAAGAASELSRRELTDGFVVSNTVIGLALALAGYPIARVRPQNGVGWLLLAAGVLYAFSGAGYAVLAWRTEPGAAAPGWRVLADLVSVSWPLAVAALIPLALLHFPDGRLHSRRWRPLLGCAAVGAVCLELVLAFGAEDTTSELGVRGYLRARWADDQAWIGLLGVVMTYTVMGGATVSLYLHHRRGDDLRRRQVLWLLLAALLMISAFLVSDVAGIDTWASIFVITLVPLAIAIAILRHQLLDIRLVVSRFLLYLVLTGCVIATYVAFVAGTDRVLSGGTPLGPPVLATLAVALAFNPARVHLQRLIDRAFYGARHDPVRAVAEVGSRLRHDEVDGVLEGLCDALRLPGAWIDMEGRRLATFGDEHGPMQAVPLALRSGPAVLAVRLRRGERVLSRKDLAVLDLVAGPVAVAVQATLYATELGRARQNLVEAREEERRRLGRDLHDGVGPVLTGVTLTAEAVRRLIVTDPARAVHLLGELRVQTTTAINEVRRLAQQLRPPVLDALGLIGALEQHATHLAPLSVDVDGVREQLPAAVEVAAFRIATEALTNVVRHANATRARVVVAQEGTLLRVVITDDGREDRAWAAGTGLSSMRDRAAELGGAFTAGPTVGGGRVEVSLPSGTA